jgi:predicted alpha/beta hydrolase
MLFCGYIAATVGVVLLAIHFKASGSKLSGVMVWCIIGLPMGHILYRLSKTNEKVG